MSNPHQPNPSAYQPKYGLDGHSGPTSGQPPHGYAPQPQQPHGHGSPQGYGARPPQQYRPNQYQPNQYQPNALGSQPEPYRVGPPKREKRPGFITLGTVLILAGVAGLVFGIMGMVSAMGITDQTPINGPTQFTLEEGDEMVLWGPGVQTPRCDVVDVEGEPVTVTYPSMKRSSSSGSWLALKGWKGAGTYTVTCDREGAYVTPGSGTVGFMASIFGMILGIFSLVLGLLFLIPGLTGGKFQWHQSVSFKYTFGNN